MIRAALPSARSRTDTACSTRDTQKGYSKYYLVPLGTY